MCTGDGDTFLGRIFPKRRVKQDMCVPVRSQSLHEWYVKSWGRRRLGIKTLGETWGKAIWCGEGSVPHLTTAETLPLPEPRCFSMGGMEVHSGRGSSALWWEPDLEGPEGSAQGGAEAAKPSRHKCVQWWWHIFRYWRWWQRPAHSLAGLAGMASVGAKQ